MSEQHWDPAAYDRHARFVSDLGTPVLDLLAAQPGERILDLGCGDGVLTARIAACGARVSGVDGSPAFVAAAQERGVDAQLMDGRRLTFVGAFDAVFSNAALHWMTDADAVLAGVHRALRPGGRFVAECGGHGNTAAVNVALGAMLARRGIDAAAYRPWSFPTADGYRAKLERAGFTVEQITLHPRPTPLPTDMRGWLETFAQAFLAPLSDDERAAALDETIALLRPVLCDERGRWSVDYVRLRFAARRSAVPTSAPAGVTP